MGLSKFSEEHRKGHTLEYKVGDLFALMPTIGPTTKIIPHVCNDVGGWGSGFVVPLGKQYPDAESQYRKWHKNKIDEDLDLDSQSFELGRLGLVRVKEPSSWTAFASGSSSDDPMTKKVADPNNTRHDGAILVANMIAQHNTINQDANLTPIRYWALAECMKKLAFKADQFERVEFHAPKFGSDRAGGNWDVIETLIEELWVPIGNVTIYTLYPAVKSTCH